MLKTRSLGTHHTSNATADVTLRVAGRATFDCGNCPEMAQSRNFRTIYATTTTIYNLSRNCVHFVRHSGNKSVSLAFRMLHSCLAFERHATLFACFIQCQKIDETSSVALSRATSGVEIFSALFSRLQKEMMIAFVT